MFPRFGKLGAGFGGQGEPDQSPGSTLDALLLEDGSSGLWLESGDDILMES